VDEVLTDISQTALQWCALGAGNQDIAAPMGGTETISGLVATVACLAEALMKKVALRRHHPHVGWRHSAPPRWHVRR